MCVYIHIFIYLFIFILVSKSPFSFALILAVLASSCKTGTRSLTRFWLLDSSPDTPNPKLNPRTYKNGTQVGMSKGLGFRAHVVPLYNNLYILDLKVGHAAAQRHIDIS